MIILNNTIENLPELINTLSNMGHVVQVRCNEILKQSLKDKLGGEGVLIRCVVQRRDNSDNYIPLKFIFSTDDVKNLEKHQQIIEKIKLTVDDYIIKDILPEGIVE